MSRGTLKRRPAPEPLPSLYDGYCIADDSPSGLRWMVAGRPSVVIGTPREVHWPNGAPEGWMGPLSYEMYIEVDQVVHAFGGVYDVERNCEYHPAPRIRALLREQLELAREIELLEQHLAAPASSGFQQFRYSTSR